MVYRHFTNVNSIVLKVFFKIISKTKIDCRLCVKEKIVQNNFFCKTLYFNIVKVVGS